MFRWIVRGCILAAVALALSAAMVGMSNVDWSKHGRPSFFLVPR